MCRFWGFGPADLHRNSGQAGIAPAGSFTVDTGEIAAKSFGRDAAARHCRSPIGAGEEVAEMNLDFRGRPQRVEVGLLAGRSTRIRNSGQAGREVEKAVDRMCREKRWPA